MVNVSHMIHVLILPSFQIKKRFRVESGDTPSTKFEDFLESGTKLKFFEKLVRILRIFRKNQDQQSTKFEPKTNLHLEIQ